VNGSPQRNTTALSAGEAADARQDASGPGGGAGSAVAASIPEQLFELAAHAGRSAVFAEQHADELAFRADAKRREADDLDRDARRVRGEAAQHLQLETALTEMAERFAKAEKRRAATSQAGDFAPPKRTRGGGLTRDERHKVDRLLRRFPNAGRPLIVEETGISDWRVRRYLVERLSQAGGSLEDGGASNEVAGGDR
jgi:hypothetical protein